MLLKCIDDGIKTYAELCGNVQKFEIKSSFDNILDITLGAVSDSLAFSTRSLLTHEEPEIPEILNLNLTGIKENFDTIDILKDTITIKPTFSSEDLFCAPGDKSPLLTVTSTETTD